MNQKPSWRSIRASAPSNPRLLAFSESISARVFWIPPGLVRSPTSSQARLIACQTSDDKALRAERALSRARARHERIELGLSRSSARVRQTLKVVAPGDAVSPGAGPRPTTASALSQV